MLTYADAGSHVSASVVSNAFIELSEAEVLTVSLDPHYGCRSLYWLYWLD
jgi:hypothetical protein